ncbi:helix-turn-helix transcriptional regulator [Petropleomorpha daqingensis]|uniref:DNA-binding CsgD family transcriptional regulator n=1 Tax=Petropleomorpha daqingensis TaxID=2026353 RepID=A0A853CC35_9ACTN|nr:helix-turn-helix transcriptional regulator [Petropleomorpha daqingensis]NYJ05304.1 DNA-binding CsgD family transcriptional regulator [Petropleomorpha daqingensis]
MEARGRSEPHRIAVVADDSAARENLRAAVDRVPGTQVVAWSERVGHLFALGSRLDVVVCTATPERDDAVRLRQRGTAVVVAGPGTDPAEVLRAELERSPAGGGVRRPRLAPRQREVLVAYVAGSDLLPTVARELGMDRETLKTHLRRIRLKYAEVGRPAPTRRDLYVRAVEDGLVPPPAEDGHHHSGGRAGP